MIAYHADGNLILHQAFQTKSNKHHIPTVNAIIEQLAVWGLSVNLNICYKEASAAFKLTFTQKWHLEFQLLPPEMHHRNKAEQMI
jgi:hypothetical protein